MFDHIFTKSGCEWNRIYIASSLRKCQQTRIRRLPGDTMTLYAADISLHYVCLCVCVWTNIEFLVRLN